MSLVGSGARAPLPSRNNSDIMCIIEIIVILYHLYQLYHYYINYFVLYQTIFYGINFVKEEVLLLFPLYILSHIIQIISIMTLIHIIRFIRIIRFITFFICGFVCSPFG